MLTYQSFRPSDLSPHLRNLLIILIVVKSIDSSTSAHIRVTHPAVLDEFRVFPSTSAPNLNVDGSS